MVDKSSITIDLERDKLFDELGIKRLKESYMREDETSPQERFAFVSAAFATDESHAQRLYDYSSKHWLSYSTPILSFGRSKRGLPISCFLPYLDDSAEGLVNTLSEVNWLSMLGGGVGIGLGIRSADDKSVGIMPHLRTYDASSLAYRQGRTRRGSYAAYLDISHPDIINFLEMRKPTGDPNLRTLNLHHGINITDDFMLLIEKCMLDHDADDTWELKDPHTQEVKDKVSARELWQRILETRMLTGEPYIHFIDTSNRAMPEFQKKKGLSIKQSNLCSEIILPTDKQRTAVCCLSSVNLEYYDDWKSNELFLRDVAEMLDNVLQYFIANDGSVQHLDFLDEYTKDVYKTGMEIDQRWVVDHAADRQHYIDQAQSINLFFRPDVNVKYLHAVHFQAWKQGLKTLYYCRSEKLAKADKVSKKIEREIIQEIDLKQLATEEVCLACEG
jgi:ribonucleoside-diphosphate reductase alpha chain